MFLLKAFWFFLPGGIANMAPVIFKKINFLNYPIDFGKTINGKPIFGSHKTFRGFFFGILVAILIALLQKALYLRYEFFREITLFPFDEHNAVLVGFLMGFGVLFGDAIKSLIKRQLGVNPGDRFIPWDQIDFIIGFILFVSIIYVPSGQVMLTILVGFPLLHIVMNHLGYYLKVQDNRW